MKIVSRICFIVLMAAAAQVLFCTAPVTADENPLAALEAERAELNSLSFTALIETPKPGGRFSRIEMAFSYMKPEKYRHEIKMGIEGNVLTICDGEFVWQYIEKKKQVNRRNREMLIKDLLENGPFEPITALTTPTLPISKLYTLEAAPAAESAERVITLTPIKPVPDYEKIVLTVSADGKTPLKAEVFKANKLTARITFKDYTRNPELNADQYKFTPPEGVTVTEL